MDCSIDTCTRPVLARSWCSMHYQRWLNYGEPEPPGVGHHAPKGELRRFFEEAMLLETDECIVWPYSTQRGYGCIQVEDGSMQRAHRLACERAHGPAPAGAEAAHGPCNDRRCINPRHLSWKTPKQNAADKDRDGTALKGSAHPNAKLTESEVLEMRKLSAEGATRRGLAERFNVSPSLVGVIVNRRRWTHVL